MGFGFYIIVAKTIASAAAFLFGVNVATTIATVAMLCGPIGWTIATVSAMTGALLIGRTNVMKTASFIIALHSMKAVALAKSEIDISKYVWQENAMKN